MGGDGAMSEKQIAELLGAKPSGLGIDGRLAPGGFIQYDAPDLTTAVALVADFKANGHYKYFRGQRYARWKVVSSLVRADAAGRAKAMRDFEAFYSFAREAPQLLPYLQDDVSLIATAQHHGLALTNFIDFTESPEVAGWFASDGANSGENGAIYLVDPEAESAFSIAGSGLKFIHLDVPNLWRLQAQAGLFLEAQGAFDHIWPLDRIVFPHGSAHSAIQRRHIYPDRKSALELALDQYLLTQARRTSLGEVMRNFEAGRGIVLQLEPEEEHKEEVPLLAPPAWRAGPNERWAGMDVDAAPPSLARSGISQESMIALVNERRNCTNLVKICDDDTGKLVRLVDLVWSGMRPHPYSSGHIARAIVATHTLYVGFEGVDMRNGLEQRRIASELLGPSIEIELSTSGENAARAFVRLDSLLKCMKKEARAGGSPGDGDIDVFIKAALKSHWNRPGQIFEGVPLVELFADEIIPWQVATGGDPIAFSAFHVLTLGRP